MKRSRRRTSRTTVAFLSFVIVVMSVVMLYRMRAKGPIAPQSMTSLSAVEAAGPAISVAQTQPAVTEMVLQAPAPIQTTTPMAPEPTAAPVQALETSEAPSTRPALWQQLLNGSSGSGGAADGTSKAGPIVTGNGPIADGKARIAAGQLLEARTVLNDALQAGHLADADAAAAKAMVSDLNQTLVFSPKVFAADALASTYLVKQGDSLAKIAAGHNTTWELLARINHLDPRRLRYGASIKVIHGPLFAAVHKKAYTMDVYLAAAPGQAGSMYLMSFPVGLGKDDSTPTGVWDIAAHAKLRHPTYYPPEGGTPIESDDPANPLGGYWIGLTGVDGDAIGRTSYGIHGTIDPSSIGKQASEGCIRLRAADIAMVFDLLVEGKSKVIVD